MFTGLIQNLGKIVSFRHEGDYADIVFEFLSAPQRQIALGDSVSVNGVCLTAVKIDGLRISAQVSSETLRRTNLGCLETETTVNLELPLTPASPMGGHFVQGHVDGIGEIKALVKKEDFWKITISHSSALSPFIVEKGSITVDGISLTVNSIESANAFSVMLIPHTWNVTSARHYRIGQEVNLETDILAKYVARMMKKEETISDFLKAQAL